jgi:hypothetical protein
MPYCCVTRYQLEWLRLKSDNTKWWQGCRTRHSWWYCKLGKPSTEVFSQTCWPLNPQAPLLATSANELKAKPAASLKSFKTRCLWQEEYSIPLMDGIPTTQAKTWMSWECTRLPERSQTDNVGYVRPQEWHLEEVGVWRCGGLCLKHCCRSKLREIFKYYSKDSRVSKFLAGQW